MTLSQFKSKEFLFTLAASVLCFAIGYATLYQKEFFVDSTGSFKIFGGIWFILAIGIQLKWKYVRYISVGVSTISLMAITLISFIQDSQYLLAYLLLIIALVLLIVLLLSKPVKSILEK